jgi:HAE1 family hydrophobic/amphiphilic exporter-1
LQKFFTSTPLAIIGVVFGLLVTQQTINLMSLIGLMVLAGIVDNDAIVKVDSILQERQRGTPLREAILLAGQKRLRPIAMNTVTTIFGMLPMMLYPGTGTEFYRPLAVAVIFGLAFATALTLVVVPVVVWVMEK